MALSTTPVAQTGPDPAFFAGLRLGLRLVHGFMGEGLLSPGSHVELTVGDPPESRLLHNADDLFNALYTMDPGRVHGAILHMDATPWPLWQPLTWLEGLARKLSDKAAPGQEPAWDWESFLVEVGDSHRNETLAAEARHALHRDLRAAHADRDNLFTPLFASPEAFDAFGQSAAGIDGFLLRLASFSGHRTHPTAKTRLRCPTQASARRPLSVAEIEGSAPEFGPLVPLVVLAVKADRVTTKLSIQSWSGNTAPRDFRDFFETAFPDAHQHWKDHIEQAREPGAAAAYLPLPVHPLQVPEIESRFAPELRAGDIVMAPDVTIPQIPTLSYRTLVPPRSVTQPSIKTTLNIQMTSVVRTLAPARAFNAPVYSDLLTDILSKEKGLAAYLRVVPEPAAIYWGQDQEGADYDAGYQLAAVFKANPARMVGQDERRLPLNALFAVSPLSTERLFIDVMRAASVHDERTAATYYAAYVRLVLQCDIGMLLRYGVSLESHQQNIDMVFGADGHPRAMVYRDINGGLEIFEPLLRARGYDVSRQIHPIRRGLHGDLDMPVRQLAHTTFMSHLIPLAHVINAGFGTELPRLFEVLVAATEALIDETLHDADKAHQTEAAASGLMAQAAGSIRQIVRGPHMEVKCLLTMRLRQSQNAVFRQVPNPLAARRKP